MHKPTMPREGQPRRAVLGVVVSHRYCGFACLDGFGLVASNAASAFGTWSLRCVDTSRDCTSRLEARMRRAITDLEPAVVVVAASSTAPLDACLLSAVAKICEATTTRFVLAAASDGLLAIGWTPGQSRVEVMRGLCRHYLPELEWALPSASCLQASASTCWRYRRTAWLATALALREFARRSPWSAVALVRDRPPRCPLLDELAQAVLVTEPAGMHTVRI